MAKSSSISSFKHFITLTLSTSLILAFGFFGASEWLLQTHIIPQDHMIKRAKLFHERPHINTIFGDSQMRDGVNMLEGFSNFSTGSQTYPEIEAKIKAFYKETDEPFKIIIHAAINNFAEYRDRPNRKEVEVFFWNDGTNGPFMTQPFFQETAWRYWKNFIANDFKIADGDLRFNPDGSTTRFGDFSQLSQDEQNKLILETIESYTPLETPKSLKAYHALNAIFDFLEIKNTTVCFVAMPLQKTMKNSFLKKSEVENVIALFKELSKNYGVNFVNLMDGDYPDHYFDDASHLNEKGANALSLKILKNCF